MTTNIDNLKRLLAEATPGFLSAERDNTHTPPFVVVESRGHQPFAEQAGVGHSIAFARCYQGHKAALIVSAVNSLPGLLAAHERLREALRMIVVTPLAIDDARDIARGALAESEGK
jgi:hypothetical protein